MQIFRWFFGSKIGGICSSLFYTLAFLITYINFLNFHFGYMGFKIVDGRLENKILIFLAVVIAIVPSLFFNGVRAISSFLSIFVYYILYVPIIISVFFGIENSIVYVILQMLLFCAGMTLFFVADRINFKPPPRFKVNFDMFPLMLIITILTTIYMLIIYRGNLSFVSFEDVYDLRSKNNELGADTISAYLFSWHSNVMIPICLGYGIFAKKYYYFIVGAFGCLIVYMATGAKSVIVFPILVIVLFKFFKTVELKYIYSLLGFALTSILIIMTMMEFNVVSSIVLMRTIGNGGDLTVHYHDFFSNHPRTYYSHVNIINLITNLYPYKYSIGQEVGFYFWGETNANANFWATDGYAAIGSAGILVSSFLFFIILVFFNMLSKSYDKVFLILILVAYITQFLNTSLFQSLLTGGLLLISVFLSFSSVHNNNSIRS